jgi:hypothetical protein
MRFAAPLYYDETTRLLADLNRSIGNPSCTRKRHGTDLGERRELLDATTTRIARRVDAAMAEAVATGDRVVHIASHSFTPQLNGHVRTADIGLLYDRDGPAKPHSRPRGSMLCGAPIRGCACAATILHRQERRRDPGDASQIPGRAATSASSSR